MQSFLMSFMASDTKLALSHLVWKIVNVFMHHLPDKKFRHFHDPGYRPDWIVGIIINYGLNFIKKFFFSEQNNQSKASKLSYFRNIMIGFIQLFLNSFKCLQIDNQMLLNLCLSELAMNDKQYSISFPNLWRSELHHCATFHTVINGK